MSRKMLLYAAPLVLLSVDGQAQVLYDGSLESTMAVQGWVGAALRIDNPFASPSMNELQSLVDSGYRLKTNRYPTEDPLHAGDFNIYAGHTWSGLTLDAAQGFTLSFTLEIKEEAHTSTNRAGYSVLVVSSDPTLSLEVAFWETRVWVYDYVIGGGEDFVQGMGVDLDTTVARNYTLEVLGTGYSLSADGEALFSGDLEDYTPRETTPDPYETPNTVFFSDNTSRAWSDTVLYRVELLTNEAEPIILVDGFESP